MVRPEFRKLLLDQRGAAVILWSFFMILVVVYIVIADSMLAKPRFSQGFGFGQTMRALLWGLTVVDLGYYVWWKKNYLRPEALLDQSKKSKLLRALAGHQGSVEERAASVVSTYVTRKVVLFAIIQAIAVYGLVLALAGRYVMDQYVLSAASLILLAFEFPSEKSLQALLQRVEISR